MPKNKKRCNHEYKFVEGLYDNEEGWAVRVIKCEKCKKEKVEPCSWFPIR